MKKEREYIEKEILNEQKEKEKKRIWDTNREEEKGGKIKERGTVEY